MNVSYSHHIVPIAGLDVPEARRRRVVLDLIPELVAVLSLLLIGKPTQRLRWNEYRLCRTTTKFPHTLDE